MLYDHDDIEQEMARIAAECHATKEAHDAAVTKLANAIRKERRRQAATEHLDDLDPQPASNERHPAEVIVRLDLLTLNRLLTDPHSAWLSAAIKAIHTTGSP